MNKTELIDKLLHLGNTTEMCSSTDRHKAKELAHTLIDEYLEAINYTRCCEELKCEGCKKALNSGLCGSCCSDLASGNY